MALLILAHPNLSRSVANQSIIDALKRSELQLEIRNLTSLYPDFQIDARAEQEALLKHRSIIFQYPLYWYNMPAILKQWFDVVFEYQFAYGSNGDKLKGKNFLPSFTIGAPEHEYQPLGEHHFRVPDFCKALEQTAYYAQMKYHDPFYFHGTSTAAGYSIAEIKAKAENQAEKLIAKIQMLEATDKTAVE